MKPQQDQYEYIFNALSIVEIHCKENKKGKEVLGVSDAYDKNRESGCKVKHFQVI